MKKFRRLFFTVLSVCLLFLTAVPMPAAAKEEEYTYTIRFFAGKQGSFAEGEMMVYEGLHYGDRINFYQNIVKINDNSKYYIRGIRESGKDNSDSVQTSSFLVTGDRDYVVAYGILGDATSYTINYVDGNGNALAPSETYYGNVGDRPVVAYIYIEGWIPEAYNMTQTLEKDPAENVFNFVYRQDVVQTPVQPPAPAPGVATPAPVPAAPTPVPGETGVTIIPAAPDTPAEDGGTPPEADIPDDDIPTDGTTPEQDIADQETPLNGTPDDLVDLDDQEVPTSNFLTLAADARLLGIPVPVVIILTMAVVGVAWYFLILKKRNKKEEKA